MIKVGLCDISLMIRFSSIISGSISNKVRFVRIIFMRCLKILVRLVKGDLSMVMIGVLLIILY